MNSESPLSFRKETVTELFSLVQSGESAMIVGMRGIGKSNMISFVKSHRARESYLVRDWQNYLFIHVNFLNLLSKGNADRNFYSLILDQLESVVKDEGEALGIDPFVSERLSEKHEALLNAGDDLLIIQRRFKQAIRELLGHSERHLVFLFDQFEEVIDTINPHLFINLRGLRETYKYRLCYLVFTHQTLSRSIIEESPEIATFYELIGRNVVGMKPYSFEDVVSTLRHVSKRLGIEKEGEEYYPKLFQISGGHAGLLRAGLTEVKKSNGTFFEILDRILVPDTPDSASVEAFGQLEDIQTECKKIWDPLSVEEKLILYTHAHSNPLESNPKTRRWLELKGLLNSNQEVFSPLFKFYVRYQEKPWETPIYLDESKRQIWVNGQSHDLTLLQFRLIRVLYQHVEEVLSVDALIEAGWPEARGGVSEAALTQNISRIREKIEPNTEEPRFLVNVRGQGYKLTTQEE